MRAKRRLTAVEFEALVPLLKISEDPIAAARPALVEGKTIQAIGDHYGWSRQAVGKCADSVWATLEQYRAAQKATCNAGKILPSGWEQVTIVAPSHLIERFRAEIAEALQEAGIPPSAEPVQNPGRKPSAKRAESD